MSANKTVLKLYWAQIRKDRLRFFTFLFGVPFYALCIDIALPYLLSLAISEVTKDHVNDAYPLLFWAAMFVVLGVSANLISFQAAVRHEAITRARLVDDTMSRLLAKDHAFFINQKVGALTTKFIDFIGAHIGLQDLLIVRTIPFILTSVLGIGIICFTAPMLGLLVGGLIIYILLQVRISIWLRTPYREARKRLVAELNGVAADTITNNITVKTFGQEAYEREHIGDYAERYRQAHIKDLRLLGYEGSLRNFVVASVQIIAIAVMIYLISQGKLELGIAVFTIAYLQRFASQLFTLGEILVGYDRIMLAATPMADILESPVHIADKKGAKDLIVTKGEVAVRNVSYAYPDSKHESVIKGLNVTIKPGQHVGVVGRSGAGKTTITNLLLRFADTKAGTIEIDKQDIRDVTQESLRHNIAYVAQEPLLFHRTLRENILYGKLDATETELYEATKKAHALEFIKKLPHGLDTVVGERGIKLSGGQRQRIAIARAILKDAPILILDEATSALDSESEKLIQDSLAELMKGRTSIVIAHRLSTIAKLDRIIVLDGGSVVEDGSHTELLKKKGIYASLWSHQSGGFIEE